MKKEELTHLKCLFNDALQPAVCMPNFTPAACSRAQFTINSWKTGCGMEPENSGPGHSLAQHPGQPKGLLGALLPPLWPVPWHCRSLAAAPSMCWWRGAGGWGLWYGEGCSEGQCHSSQRMSIMHVVHGKSPVALLLHGFVMGTLICCWD